MNARPVFMISGKHPVREVGGFGHSVYVRAHAWAAVSAGYEPHIFCIGNEDVTESTAFGTVHQHASRLPARQYAIGRHAPRTADAIVAFAKTRPADEVTLLHGFAVWSYAGALALERLEALGRRGVLIASSYTTHADESRALFDGAKAGDGSASIPALWAQYLWSRTVVTHYERRGYRAAHTILANYSGVLRAIERRHGKMLGMHLARYGSARAFESPAPVGIARPESAAPRIASVSGHFHRKGVDVLLRAYALLRDRGAPFRAVVVGGGTLLEEHRRLAKRLRLDDVVRIVGLVPDVAPYLVSSDVFVLPSRSEQSGSLSLIEALEYGLPVVASNCDGIPEDLAGSEAGVLVPPGDPQALANALERLVRDPDERLRRGHAARSRFVERFSPTSFAHDLGHFYAEALAHN